MVNTRADDSIQSLTTGIVFTLKQEIMWITISIVKPTRCTNVSNLFYFGMTLYVSGSLSVHHQEFKTTYSDRHLSNRYCCLLTSGYPLASKFVNNYHNARHSWGRRQYRLLQNPKVYCWVHVTVRWGFFVPILTPKYQITSHLQLKQLCKQLNTL
jgi:hypothetical protein